MHTLITSSSEGTEGQIWYGWRVYPNTDERRDFDKDFEHENDNFDHNFYYKGGLFPMM